MAMGLSARYLIQVFRFVLTCILVLLVIVFSLDHKQYENGGIHLPVYKPMNYALAITTNNDENTFRQHYLRTKKFTFLIAGVQKCATTTIHSILRQHPYIFLTTTKELHFFDRERLNWKKPKYKRYQSNITPKSPRYAIGESTPIYIFWPNSLKRIKSYNPAMKLIFMFCDPAKRAFSQWKMSSRRNVENETFSWAIREGRTRIGNRTNLSMNYRVYTYVERGFYGKQLQRVLKVFPREQLLFLLTEDLITNTTDVIRQVSDFLNIPYPPYDIPLLWRNKGSSNQSISKEDEMYLRNLYRDDLNSFAKLSGFNINKWLT